MFGPMVGRRQVRVEDLRLIAGQGRFTDDFTRDGEAHCVFVRSPVAHARIISIGCSEALEIEGALAVLTGADFIQDGLKPIDHRPNPADAVDPRRRALLRQDGAEFGGRPHYPLASDRATYLGEPIACVIAETAAAAQDAAERVEIVYEAMPEAITVSEALSCEDGDPGGRVCFDVCIGSAIGADDELSRSAHIVRHRFVLNRVANCQLEPRSALGIYEDGKYTLISGNQGVSRMQMLLAECLGTAVDEVRVVSPDVGGGFGPRTYLYSEQVCVLWAARRLKRAVRWTSTRSEAFLTDYQGRDGAADVTMGLSSEGTIVAYRVDYVANLGAHTVAYVTAANAMRMFPTMYRVKALDVRVRGVVTNTVPTAPYRGAGRPEANHFMERMLDIAAAQSGLDRINLRRINLVTPNDLPFVSPAGLTYDAADFPFYMECALTSSNWAQFHLRREESEARGRYRGIGLANHLEAPVGAPVERVVLRIVNGLVELVVGTQSTGQGHETTFAQVVSDLLELPFEQIRVISGDTREVSNGGGTHSDRSLRYISLLATRAADRLIASGQKAAAELMQSNMDEVTYRAGVYRAMDTGAEIPLLALASSCEPAGRNSWFEPSVAEEMFGRIPVSPAGCAVCEVEVDPETGLVDVIAYTAVDDVGLAINPMIVEGQSHGGIAQGLGQAMREGVAHAGGQCVTGSFMDYALCRADDVPNFVVSHVEIPTEGNPYRIKGGGEGGNVPATAAFINAVCHALAGEALDFDMPLRAPAVWRAARKRTS